MIANNLITTFSAVAIIQMNNDFNEDEKKKHTLTLSLMIPSLVSSPRDRTVLDHRDTFWQHPRSLVIRCWALDE